MRFLRLFALIGIPLILIVSNVAIYVVKITLSSEAIPTLVSGIASSTSIIVGFSGTLLGLMFREIKWKNGLTYKVQIVIAAAIIGLVISAGQLWLAFLSLSQSYYIDAVRNSLSGLLISLCTLFGLAIIIIDKMLESLDSAREF